MSKVETLPTEIFNEIYSNLDSSFRTYQHVSSLTRTCRAFYYQFMPKLYQSLHLGEHEQDGITGLRLAKLARTLLRNSSISLDRNNTSDCKDLAFHVKNITIGAISHDHAYQGKNPCNFTHDEYDWFHENIVPLQIHAKRPSNYPFHFTRSHFKLQANTKDFFVAAILKRCERLRSLICEWDFLLEGNGIIDGFFGQIHNPCLKTVELNYSSASVFDVDMFKCCDIESLRVKDFMPRVHGYTAECYSRERLRSGSNIMSFQNLHHLTSLTIVTQYGEPEALLALLSPTTSLKSLYWEETAYSTNKRIVQPLTHAEYAKKLDIYREALGAIANTIEQLHILLHSPFTRSVSPFPVSGQVHNLHGFSRLKTLKVSLRSLADSSNSGTHPFADVLPNCLDTLKLRIDQDCPEFWKPQATKLHDYIKSMDRSGDCYVENLFLDIPESYKEISDKISPLCTLKSIHLEVLLQDRDQKSRVDREEEARDAYMRMATRSYHLLEHPGLNLRPQSRRCR